MGTAMHIELDALCLLVLCVIVWQSVRNVNQQMRKIRFRNTVYGIMAALALDIIWMLIDGKVFPGAIALNWVVNALFLGLGVLLGCIWYLYVLDTLGYHVSGKLTWVFLLPGILFTALDLISIRTGWIFYITEENAYVRGPGFWLQEIGAIAMLLVSFFHILFCSFRKQRGVPASEVRKLLGFYIIPVIGTLVSMPFTGMPGTWTCGAVSIILIYMNALDHEVLRDSLTGLNNRKALDSVYPDFSKIASPENRLYLFMMDLDGFKGINDRNGHPAGDQALITAAKLLQNCIQNMRSIAVRYGGDEFLVMGFPENDPVGFIRRVQSVFDEYNATSDVPYRLNFSIGYAEYETGQTMEDLISKADMNLYRAKTSKPGIAGR